ncbi:apolipoprotein N-acyltransferase [Akkermansiaceae bacterium]|nr:apolipoprotein N-acyltransferase [Akkermansiaceae bacterium]MDB4801308.1 apolipoprotein N-acyltransferase [Akkermansiaceae bacterium]
MMVRFLRILAAILSGIALAFSFAPFDEAWIVWGWMWLLLPLLWTVPGKGRCFKGFGLGWLAGMGFWVINLKWLGTVTWPGALALSAYLSAYFGLFGAFAAGPVNPCRVKYERAKMVRDRARQTLRSLGYATLLGGFWCGLEWVRGWLMTGFGWNGLGVTFAKNLILAQNAEYVGVIGLSFLPVFFSAVAVQTVRRFYQQFRANELRILHWDFATALLVIMLAFTWGTIRLSSVTNEPKIEGRVLMVQQDIPQFADKILWEPSKIVGGFEELTAEGMEEVFREAAKAARGAESEEEIVGIRMPDLVIWPEACLPAFLHGEENGSIVGGPEVESVFEYIHSLGDFTFVLGMNEARGETVVDPEVDVFNSLIVDDGKGVRQTYQKNHLVILGEFIPDLPFLHDLYFRTTGVEFGKGLSRGGVFEPLEAEIGGQPIGVIPSVCFEDTVPRLTRKFVRNGPQLLVNVTNDGWFQESEGSVQHFRNALFRSIELRRPTVRCANRGVTGVVTLAGSLVDPYSKKTRHLVDENGSYFHRGYLLATVYIPSEGEITLYAAFGDWFAVSGLIAGFFWVFLILLSKKTKRREG